MTRSREQKILEPARLTITVEPSPEGYRLRDQELGLEATGKGLAEAYGDLLKRREKIISALDAAAIPYEAVALTAPRNRRPILPIFLGVGALFAGFLLLADFALSPLVTRGERFLKAATAATENLKGLTSGVEKLVKVATPAAEKADKLLARWLAVSAADKFRGVSSGVHALAEAMDKMTPDKRQQLQDDLRKLAIAGKPFAEELRPLFEAGNTPSGQAPSVAKERPDQLPNSNPQ